MRKVSNCRLRAWKKFTTGEAEWIAIRHTKYATLAQYAHTWPWKLTFGVIGIIFQWVGAILSTIGWALRWGGWYHATWIDKDGNHWELVPSDHVKRKRIIPPPIFMGVEQKVKNGVKI